MIVMKSLQSSRFSSSVPETSLETFGIVNMHFDEFQFGISCVIYHQWSHFSLQPIMIMMV